MNTVIRGAIFFAIGAGVVVGWRAMGSPAGGAVAGAGPWGSSPVDDTSQGGSSGASLASKSSDPSREIAVAGDVSVAEPQSPDRAGEHRPDLGPLPEQSDLAFDIAESPGVVADLPGPSEDAIAALEKVDGPAADYLLQQGPAAAATILPAPMTSGGLPVLTWDHLRYLDPSSAVPAFLQEHDGDTVRIPGFMVPLEDWSDEVSEFLLVPYPQACIHVPPPPANQIVHVVMNEGRKATMLWYEPVWVEGTLHIDETTHMYGSASFSLDGVRTLLYEPAAPEG